MPFFLREGGGFTQADKNYDQKLWSKIVIKMFYLVDTDDEEPVEIDVCLRGFSAVPLGRVSSKVHIYCQLYSMN